MDLDNLIATGKHSMEKATANGDDFLPMLLVEAGGQLVVVAMTIDGDPVDYLPAVLQTIAETDPITSISFTSDTFYVEDVNVPRPYSAAFAAGDGRVSEAMMISGVTVDQHDILVLLPYTRLSNGLLWGEPIERPGMVMGGRVFDALRDAIRRV